jgi:hypothetical protein
MGTITKLILTTIAGAIVPLVAICLPLLSCVCAIPRMREKTRRETSLLKDERL